MDVNFRGDPERVIFPKDEYDKPAYKKEQRNEFKHKQRGKFTKQSSQRIRRVNARWVKETEEFLCPEDKLNE